MQKYAVDLCRNSRNTCQNITTPENEWGKFSKPENYKNKEFQAPQNSVTPLTK